VLNKNTRDNARCEVQIINTEPVVSLEVVVAKPTPSWFQSKQQRVIIEEKCSEEKFMAQILEALGIIDPMLVD
jgi:hypothetical protein